METLGGWWKLKDIPSEDKFALQIKMIEKIHLSAEMGHKMHASVKEGTLVQKTEIKDLGGGLYSCQTYYGDQMNESKFTLDGSPTENMRVFDGKKFIMTSTFEGGVWKATVTMDGIPDVIIERKRVGDEVIEKKICDDITLEDVEVPVWFRKVMLSNNLAH